MESVRFIIGPDDGTASIARICARAVILFVFGIICIRIAGRRTFAQYSPLDIIVAIVVGSNISRIMTGKAAFVAGAAATLLIVVLHRMLAMLSLRWPVLGGMIKGRAVVLIEDGRIDERMLARHEISRDDLLEALRMEQVEDPERVRRATLEGGGKISVVRREPR
jgi:uncharacterized membrane protein YcaP (DUF421 family)